MPKTPEPEATVGTIAKTRSRSRYKGPRPNNIQSPLQLTAGELESDREIPLPPRKSKLDVDPLSAGRTREKTSESHTVRPRQMVSDCSASAELVPLEPGQSGGPSDRTTEEDKTKPSQQMLRDSRRGRVGRRRSANADVSQHDIEGSNGSQQPSVLPGQDPPNLLQDSRKCHDKKHEIVGSPPALPRRTSTRRVTGHTGRSRRRRSWKELKEMTSVPTTVISPQSIVTPAFDAPISAVNAGERRVRVECGQCLAIVSVTPTTTPVDIVHSTAEKLGKFIDLKNTVLLESFGQLGLERPLRRYEHIRDIMNSWDNDEQNKLLIAPSPTGGKDDDLEFNSVSSSQPGDKSECLYHSQKPGNWDKRWVTLRSDGQVLMAKKDGGEAVNICHLSDFDIYIPTKRQLKKIKPPRKICFSVKSQQKSSMFMSTINFVHFFSTSDKSLAASWYTAIHEWRSWYLVHVMGMNDGQEGSKNSHKDIASKNIQSSTDSETFIKVDNKLRLSSQPGTRGVVSSQNTTNINDADPMSLPRPFDSAFHAANKLSHTVPIRSGTKALPAKSGIDTKFSDTGSSATGERNPAFVHASSPAEPFTTTGLLGRTYTQLQQAQGQREKIQNVGQDKKAVIPRDEVQHPKMKPLVDLTPRYQEPPQHKRGRGVVLKEIPDGGLVEAANNMFPEAAISIPPLTAWRRHASSGEDGSNVHRTTTIRDCSRGALQGVRQTSKLPDRRGVDQAFVDGGLLTTASNSQDGSSTGKGIMIGDRQAKASMLR